MGQIIKIVNIIFLIIIIIVLQDDNTKFYDWAFMGSTWFLLEFTGLYITQKYIDKDMFNKPVIKEYIDADSQIDKGEYSKIIFSIVLLIVNLILYLYCKLEEQNYFISIISSVLVIIALFSLGTGWLDNLINNLKKKNSKK